MKLKTISRRSFLKGAGVTALAVAAAGMMTACGDSSSSKKDPVTPNPTPTTKEVTVKYVIGGTNPKTLCTDTINVDVTKLDAANPTIPSSSLTLPADFRTGYKIMDNENGWPIDVSKLEVTVYVEKVPVATDNETVTIKYTFGTKGDVTADIVAKGAKATVEVPAGSDKLSTAGLLPSQATFEYEAEEATVAIERMATNNGLVATVALKKKKY